MSWWLKIEDSRLYICKAWTGRPVSVWRWGTTCRADRRGKWTAAGEMLLHSLCSRQEEKAVRKITITQRAAKSVGVTMWKHWPALLFLLRSGLSSCTSENIVSCVTCCHLLFLQALSDSLFSAREKRQKVIGRKVQRLERHVFLFLLQ